MGVVQQEFHARYFVIERQKIRPVQTYHDKTSVLVPFNCTIFVMTYTVKSGFEINRLASILYSVQDKEIYFNVNIYLTQFILLLIYHTITCKMADSLRERWGGGRIIHVDFWHHGMK